MVEMKVSSRWFRDKETSPQNGVGLVIKCHLVKEKKKRKIHRLEIGTGRKEDQIQEHVMGGLT